MSVVERPSLDVDLPFILSLTLRKGSVCASESGKRKHGVGRALKLLRSFHYCVMKERDDSMGVGMAESSQGVVE